jgi:hypothetical protein
VTEEIRLDGVWRGNPIYFVDGILPPPEPPVELITMKLNRSATASPSPELIDAVMERYVTWREQSAAVEAAYRRWSHAAAEDRNLCFDDYAAALDQEELAADDYRRLIEQAGAGR